MTSSQSSSGLIDTVTASSSSVATLTTDYGGRTAPVTFSPSQTSTQSQTISSTNNGGLGDTSGISAGVSQVNATFSELIMNGGIAAGVGLIATSVFLYTIVICQRKRALTKTATSIPQKNFLTSSSSSPSFLVINPLKEHQQQPQLPLSRPPTTKSLKKAGSGVKR